MSDISKAWVWNSYRGVVDAAAETAGAKAGGKDTTEVVRLRTVSSSGQRASGARTKFGIAIATSVLIGAFFPMIALLLFLIAALLIVSGREPEKTKEVFAGLPGGDLVEKALGHIDAWLA
jgi:hypothetical protein